MISTLLDFGKDIYKYLSGFDYTSGRLSNSSGTPDANTEEAKRVLFSIYTNGQGARSSVTRLAEKSIAYYPLVVSDSIQPDNIFKIAKLVESRVASYIKIILTTQLGSMNVDKADFSSITQNFSSNMRLGSNRHAPTGFSNYSVEESLMTCADLNKTHFVTECLFNPQIHALTEADTDKKKPKNNGVNIEQRSNSIMPTIVTLDVNIHSQGGTPVTKKISVGVKAVPHVAASNELIDAMSDMFSNSSVLLKFIRWTTGEISFFRDIVANYSEIQKAEKNSSDSNGHRMINHLKQYATGSALNMALREQSKFIPTTTLLLNKTDVEQIRTATGIDILRDTNAKKMCADLALMTVMVIDENLDAVHIYDDNSQGSYELYSLKDLNKNDSGKIETLFKALIDPRR